MLRARMAKRKEAGMAGQQIEVPAELLAGLDDQELEADEEWIDEANPKAGKKKKDKAKAKQPVAKPGKTEKKKAPKKRWAEDEEEDFRF